MDRDFIFGVLAVQVGFATPGQVMSAAAGFLADKSRSIAARLQSDGVLDEQKLAMLEGMVAEAVKVHGGSVEQTMESLGGEQALFKSFGGSLQVDAKGDLSLAPDVERSGDSEEDSAAVTPEAAGRYLVGADAEIGRGGIGRILVAYDEHLGREVAVKELLIAGDGSRQTTPRGGQVSRTAAVAARFLREARVTGQLEHPNIVPVHEVGQRDDGSYYYTMKLVRGRTLAEALANCQSLGDRLKLLHHYVDLCNAVAYAHARGIIHRDIKTENVMLGEFGETVVLDWGLAKVKGKKDIRGQEIERDLKLLQDEGAGKTIDGSAIGTPAYMSPEQAEGLIDDIDERSDVWSLGAVLYEVLTGRPPFAGSTPFEIIGKVIKDDVVPPSQLADDVPAELSAVAARALTRRRAKRYQKAGELAAEIEAYVAGGRIAAYEYSAWELVQSFVAQHRAASALAAVILLLVVGGSVVLYGAYRAAGTARDEAKAEQGRAEQEKTRAEQGELQAELYLASALQEKADGLYEERRILSSRVYSAAALNHHPCTRLGLGSTAACDARFPGASLLRTRAISNVYQADLNVLARPEWTQAGKDGLLRLQISADGKRLLTANSQAKLQLWDIEKRRALITLEGSVAARRKGAALSPDGRIIAACQGTDAIGLFSATGDRLGTLSQPGGAGRTLAFAPDGLLLAAASADGTVALWDVAKRTRVRTLKAADAGRGALAFSPDGALLASAAPDLVVVWDVASGARRWDISGLASVSSLSFSPDSKRLAIGNMTRALIVIDVQARTIVHRNSEHRESVSAVQFAPDGSLLLSASPDGTLRFWDAASYELVYAIGSLPPAMDAQFVPGASLIASAHEDGSLRLWRFQPAETLPVLRGHTDRTWEVAASPDGRLLATPSSDATVRLWDVAGRRLQKVLEAGAGPFTYAAFSPDGRLVAACQKRGDRARVMVWEVESGEQRHVIEQDEASIFALAWSPDGRALACRSMDGKTRLYDLRTGQMLREIEKDGAGQGLVQFSPDGRLLATGGVDKTVRLWEVASGKRQLTLTGHEDLPYSFTFTADGSQLLSCGKGGSLLLWDTATGAEVRRFIGHQRWVNGASIVPGRGLFASASDEGTVRLWSLATGEQRLIIKTAREAYAATALPDGKTLALIDGEGINRIKLYPLDLAVLEADPKALLARAEQEAGLKLEGSTLVPAK